MQGIGDFRSLMTQNTDLGTQKKVYVKTYGCQTNVYDSQRMVDLLEKEGFVESDSPEGADLILLNTCHIREKAAEKVYSELGRLRESKEEGARVMIGVVGCFAQAEGDELLRRAACVDFVCGPQSYHHLPRLIRQAQAGEKPMALAFATEDKFIRLSELSKARTRPQGKRRSPTAFLAIQEGCDKFCSFCVVPYTRGAELSRPVEQIVAEVRRLATEGVREITLLGQNVNAYHGKNAQGKTHDLADLLAILSEIEGIARLRYTTSHPRDMTPALIAAHRDLPRVMPFLHLPVQSGSNTVLKAMNRKHSREHYIEIVAALREARPDIALSSDFIVGFPGETDQDFEETLDLVVRIGFTGAFSFQYSSRPGTPAAERTDQVPQPIKAERLQRLQALLEAQQKAFNASFLGREVTILLEKPGQKPGQLMGRTPWAQAVHVDSEADGAAGALERRLGHLLPVQITALGHYTLFGVSLEGAREGT